MSRASRTAEILAALQLAPMEVEREQARARQQNASARALASLVPALIEGGAGIAGDVVKTQRVEARQAKADAAKERDALARIADRKAITDAQKARADAAKAKAEADKAKATIDAAEAARKAEGEASKTTAEQSMAALRSAAGAPGASLETLIGRASVDPGLGNLDDTAVAGILAEEQAKTRKEGAGATLAERKAIAPLGPKPKSPEEIRRQEVKDKIAEATLKQLEGKPEAAAAAAGKLTAGEAESIIELQTGQEILNNIEKLKKSGGAGGAPINTGPIEAVESWLRSKAGVESPEKAQFKAAAGAQLAEYIKSISGGAVSKEERASLLENVPTPADDDEEFIAKLEAVRNILTTKLETKRRAYQATGKDTSIFTAPAAPAAPSKPISEMTDEELAARRAQLKGTK